MRLSAKDGNMAVLDGAGRAPSRSTTEESQRVNRQDRQDRQSDFSLAGRNRISWFCAAPARKKRDLLAASEPGKSGFFRLAVLAVLAFSHLPARDVVRDERGGTEFTRSYTEARGLNRQDRQDRQSDPDFHW